MQTYKPAILPPVPVTPPEAAKMDSLLSKDIAFFEERTDRIASVTTSWSHEAEQRMERVPSFVRPMAKMAILRYAQEQGHTVITERLVEEATAQLMPGRAEEAMTIVAAWSSPRSFQRARQ